MASNVAWRALALVLGIVLGVVYLRLLHLLLELLWTTIPQALDRWVLIGSYTIGMLVLGATAVALLRARTGVFGHSPLDGLSIAAAPVRSSLISLTAVVITLLSGAVLGPEAGLLALGAAVGTALAHVARLDPTDGAMVRAGALGGILGLFANMFAGDTIRVTNDAQLAWLDVVWSVPVALAAALVLIAVRLPAYRLRRWADSPPVSVPRVALVGLAVGLVGVAGFVVADAEPRMILGSGEGFINDVLQVSSLATLAVILVAKAVAYSLCLGGGLRGGPIFPAMFLGAATAALFVRLGVTADSPALVAAGVSAAFAVGLKLPTLGLVIAGAGTGLLLGGPWLVAPSVIGVLVGKLVARGLHRLPGAEPVPDAAGVRGLR